MTRITVNAANDNKKNTTVKLLQGAIKREGKILKAGLEKTARNLKDFEKKIFYDFSKVLPALSKWRARRSQRLH